MKTVELQYDLPPERIAQHPVEPRDAARLLVIDRATGDISHRIVRDLPGCLNAGDCLVLNNTRVLPARFFCRRATGGRIEAFFLRVADDGWRLLLKPSARLGIGETLLVEPLATPVHAAPETIASRLVLRTKHDRGEWAAVAEPPADPLRFLDEVGQPPLPPYIHRDPRPEAEDSARYQTVFASQPGAIAAPTAGLHFTPGLLDTLAARGVRRAEVTLHVGLGTFAPIDVDDLADHRMHAEWFEVNEATAGTLHETRGGGGRIVAVGTTSARVLETLAAVTGPPCADGGLRSGWTQIFLYPPYRFRAVDALLTNFHLPGSTLLAMVMAFAGVELIRRAYAIAIAERYRFYSYGDAMLIV
ncbi:MAG: tRNA preQ1(34) S-adenosylmethionine ribosyltransferase-isomerase QueA [Planctomycetes bacterium]|nr:tRNA preQ1(34) S-adenosylmethionine ribosyltransferase-isomerase QueA [Planctomycetota bacterium]